MKLQVPIRVGIIDSGINTSDARLCEFVVVRRSVRADVSEVSNAEDEIGHGTACADLITRGLSHLNVVLFVYKLFGDKPNADYNTLTKAFELAIQDDVDIINCSLGSIDPNAKHQLQPIVDRVVQKGIIVVSAWNDDGYTTYPASFQNVICVRAGMQNSQSDWGYVREKGDHFVFRGTKQRVRWKDANQIFIGGSSFATALCTRKIVELLLNGEVSKEIESIKSYLKCHAQFTEEKELRPSPLIPWNEFHHKVRNVGLYPFNKEMHTFLRFRKELPYNVSWVSDFKFSKNAGKTVNNVLQNCDDKIVINAGLKNDLGTTDALIVGYLDVASEAQKKDLLDEALSYALTKKQNVFSFLHPKEYPIWADRFASEGLWLDVPFISYDTTVKILEQVPEKKSFDTPVVAVVGTSQKQGKFTVQLALRYELMKQGLRVGQIGTEHQSGCFGIDYTFPSGYGAASSLQIPLDFHVPLLRRVLSEMDKGQFDVIVVGAQSGVLSPDPYYYGCLPTELMLTAAVPDYTILVTNPNDEKNFVRRISSYIFAKTGLDTSETLCFDESFKANLRGRISEVVGRFIAS